MEKSCFKVFFSKIRECEWLNKMGSEGYLLTDISDSKYYFDHSDELTYTYSIEYLNSSPNSDESAKYYESRRPEEIFPIISAGNWVYFASTSRDFSPSADSYKKNALVYLWRSLYLFFFAVAGTVVCGYQAFASDYLIRAGHGSDGMISLFEIDYTVSSFLQQLLNAIKIWANYIIDFVNNSYLKLLRDIFAESDAVLVLAVLIPIVIILTVCLAFHIDEYLKHIKLSKNISSLKNTIQECGGNDAE